MRILHAITPGVAGGLESVVLALAGGQAARGHEVSVAAVVDRKPDPHPLLVSLEQAGVAVDRIPARGRRYLRERHILGATSAARGAELVHTHGYRSDVLGGSAARRLGLPTVTTVHGFTGGDRKNRIYEGIQFAAFRYFDSVIAVSAPLKRNLVRRGVPVERIELLPNAWAGHDALPGEEARARLGLPPGVFIAGWIGRISHEKGLDIFLEALADPAAAGIVAAIVGEGKERPALEIRAAELGLAGRLHWCG
ncbi:MAG: glycosyltransferase, partial [Gemmatimonadales bacterium]